MELTQARVRELFDYRDDGTLIAKERANGRKFGMPVGCETGGYLIAMVSGKLYKVHRLIFLWHHGYMPVEVDHKDLNGLNNRIENLRDADSAKNKYNRGRNRNNTSGFKGVYYDKRRKKWIAQIVHNRQRIYLGQYDEAKKAHHAYKEEADRLFGEFARAG